MKYLFCLLLFFTSSLVFAQSKTGITYSFDCMRKDLLSGGIGFFTDLEEEAVRNVGDDIKLEDEKKVGDETYTELKKTWRFIDTGTAYNNLKRIAGLLKSKMLSPKGYTYSVYLLDTSMLNAFTVGGKIFFTTEMYKFCRSDDEIACILGHEMSHNELGHIKIGLSRIKTASRLGLIGYVSANIAKIMTISFNQKNEAHSDFLGADLAIAAGFNACQAVKLWERMKAKEGDRSDFMVLLRSHPYSATRAKCIGNHLSTNYQLTCGK